MNELNKILEFIPEPWRSRLLLVALASPYITRAVYALMNQGGIKGIVKAIWLGTNTPKSVPDGPQEKKES